MIERSRKPFFDNADTLESWNYVVDARFEEDEITKDGKP